MVWRRCSTALTGGLLLVSAADQFTLDRLRMQFQQELLAAGPSAGGGSCIGRI